MELLLLEIFLALGAFLLFIAIAADSRMLAFFSAVFFLISALNIILSGVDIKTGTTQTCNSFALNGTNQSACVSQTTADVLEKHKDRYTEGAGIVLLLLAVLLFYLISVQGGNY